MLETFSDVIDLWATPDTLGYVVLAPAIRSNVEQVKKWGQRNSIPSDWWERIIDVARRQGKPVTLEDLARIAARPTVETESAA